MSYEKCFDITYFGLYLRKDSDQTYVFQASPNLQVGQSIIWEETIGLNTWSDINSYTDSDDFS